MHPGASSTNTQFKSRELSLKGYTLKIHKKQLRSNQNTDPPLSLSPETLQLIEQPSISHFPTAYL